MLHTQTGKIFYVNISHFTLFFCVFFFIVFTLQLRTISSTVGELISNVEACDKRLTKLEDSFINETTLHSQCGKHDEDSFSVSERNVNLIFDPLATE